MMKKEFENMEIEIINCDYDIITNPSTVRFGEDSNDIDDNYYEV